MVCILSGTRRCSCRCADKSDNFTVSFRRLKAMLERAGIFVERGEGDPVQNARLSYSADFERLAAQLKVSHWPMSTPEVIGELYIKSSISLK
jgi:hypothetical protein